MSPTSLYLLSAINVLWTLWYIHAILTSTRDLYLNRHVTLEAEFTLCDKSHIRINLDSDLDAYIDDGELVLMPKRSTSICITNSNISSFPRHVGWIPSRNNFKYYSRQTSEWASTSKSHAYIEAESFPNGTDNKWRKESFWHDYVDGWKPNRVNVCFPLNSDSNFWFQYCHMTSIHTC